MNLINQNQIVHGREDSRTFIWGHKYTPSNFYRFLFQQLPKDAGLNEIWNSKALPKLKVFSWLLMIDRLNTKDLMLRKHWHIESGPECVLCQQVIMEDRDHLFFECFFAVQCWHRLNIHWDMSQPISERLLSARANFTGPCFMEIVACAAWNIWKIRNDVIFRDIPASFARWKIGFQNDVMLHRYKVKSCKVQPLLDWLLALSL
jgi:hypothetical protein